MDTNIKLKKTIGYTVYFILSAIALYFITKAIAPFYYLNQFKEIKSSAI